MSAVAKVIRSGGGFKTMSTEKKFITESPKLNFFFGLIIGVAVVALVGFGGLMLTRDNSNGSQDKQPEVAGEQQPDQPSVDLKIADGDHFLGNKKASVKIFTFSDFQCPYCARHHETMHQLVDEYGDQIAWVFKQFPIASHPLGMPGALATECADEQGKFWEMSDKIFESQQTLAADSFATFAQELGLDVDQFNSCMDDEKYKNKILADYNLGIESGVRGTPSNFINNESVPGAIPLENLKEMVDNLLK